MPGSNNLNLSFPGAQQRIKKLKEKCATFCFIKFSAKVSPKSSGDFSVHRLGLFFQS